MEVERILVVGAHPDDIEYGAAGTVARWTAEGATVTYCVITDGDSGGFDPDVDRADIPAIRRAMLGPDAALPSADMKASLVSGTSRHFLVYQNYDALLQYNCAHAYALSVALLGDRIGA